MFKAIKRLFEGRLSPEERFDKEMTCKIVKTTIEFENGVVRTLQGEAAHAWYRDIYLATCGRQVDWKKHKWEQTIK